MLKLSASLADFEKGHIFDKQFFHLKKVRYSLQFLFCFGVLWIDFDFFQMRTFAEFRIYLFF